jgi:hypothetical protein
MRPLTGLWVMIAAGTAGCADVTPRLYAPIQSDGWSAQPVSIVSRFAPDADLDPATRTPVGDEGYYFYILTKAGAWDYSTTKSFLLSCARQRWGHSWLILESPGHRLECGLNGNFGRVKPMYDEGVSQRLRDGDPNPISYLWETMPDGLIEIGNGNRIPTFVWRMPITRRRHQQIQDYVMQRQCSQIDVRSNNCVDMVTEAAELAGIHMIHRVRLTFPPETTIWWRTLRIWTDPQYRILEFSTPDVLEMDLRHLAQFGIGSDVTEWYLDSGLAVPTPRNGGQADGAGVCRDEDGMRERGVEMATQPGLSSPGHIGTGTPCPCP